MIEHKRVSLKLVTLLMAALSLAAFVFIVPGDDPEASNLSGSLFQVSFERSDQVFEPASTFEIVLGDVDDDGDLDAVLSNMHDVGSRVWHNDGNGHFTDSGQLLTEDGHGVRLGDLDGDGDLDMVMTCASDVLPTKVYFNDGTGRFTDSEQDLGDTDVSGNGVELIDIDTDGDLDAYVVYYQMPDKVYLNNGSGIFDEGSFTVPDGSFATWGDLDNDGDTDVILKEEGAGYSTLLNDGAGLFSEDWSLADTSAVFGDIRLGDLDGDGDLDAVVANGDRTGAMPTRVILNDGAGRFTDTGQELSETFFSRLVLDDADGDGSLDVFLFHFQSENEIWINNGAGRFSDSGLRMNGPALNGHGATGDLDNDGDLDIFEAVYVDGPNVVWFNQGTGIRR